MRKTLHRITFQDRDDQEVLLQAQIGIGNRELMRITGLTDSQINNRLRKAKNGLGMEHGFRVNWRNGNHPLFQRMLKDYRGVMLLDIKRKLVPLYAHPTPETT
jgi:hypothetical protein